MHPVLVEIPIPAWRVPLWPIFALLFGFATYGAYRGFLRRVPRLTLASGAMALGALAAGTLLAEARVTLGALTVPAWGALLSLALALGVLLTLRDAERSGLSRDAAFAACLAGAIGGVLGARLVWAALHARELGSWAATFALFSGGLSVWGALAGGVAGALVESRRAPFSLGKLLDAAAPGFAAGVVITRIGCWLEGCDFGIPLGANAPTWLQSLGRFPARSPAWTEQVLRHGLTPSAPSSLAVHPTELYEVLGGLALLGVALALRSRKYRAGSVFGATVFGYVLFRAALDGLRDDPLERWVSRTLAALALLGFATLAVLRRRAVKSPL